MATITAAPFTPPLDWTVADLLDRIGDVLPGFSLALRDLFSEAEGG